MVQSTSVTEGTSPGSKYEVQYSPSGSQTRVVVSRAQDGAVRLDTTVTGDLRAGFSPDDDRFSTVVVSGSGGPQTTTATLWDLAAGTNSNAWDESFPSGSATVNFSKQGRYLMFAGLTGANQMALRLIDARRGSGAERVRHSANFAYTSPPADEPTDSYGVIRWGFSPDESDRSFAYGYITGQSSYNLVVANLASGISRAEPGLDVSAFWQFSPCGDALVKVGQPNPDFLSASLFSIETMAPPVRKDGMPLGFAEVITRADNHVLRVTQGTTAAETILAPNSAARTCVRSLSMSPIEVVGGKPATGTVTLVAPAPPDGFLVALTTSDDTRATVPLSVTVPGGATSATFTVGTTSVTTRSTATLGASAAPRSATASLPNPPHASAVLTLKPNTPPTAHFSGPGSTFAGVAATFTDSSSDPDGTVVDWSWSFGDGSTASGSTGSHRYAEAGAYTVTLTVTDNDGATASATRNLTVLENQAPVASFTTSPAPPTVGSVFTATSTSSDPDDGISSYQWKLSNKVISTQPTAVVRLACAGTLALTVTDSAGNVDTETADLGGDGTEIPGSAVPVAERSFPDSATAQAMWDQEQPVAKTSVQLNSFCPSATYAEHKGQSAVTGPVSAGSYGTARVDLPVDVGVDEVWGAIGGVDVTPADQLGQDVFVGYHQGGQLYRVTGPASVVPVDVEAVITYEVRAKTARTDGEPASLGVFESLRWSLQPTCWNCGASTHVSLTGDSYSWSNRSVEYDSSTSNVYIGSAGATVFREDVGNYGNESALAGVVTVPLSVLPGTFLRTSGTYNVTGYASQACASGCTGEGELSLRVSFRAADPRWAVAPLAGLGPDGGDPADLIAPEVLGAAERVADHDDWHQSPVVINWSASDPYPTGSGLASQPAPTLASREGAHTYASDPSCDGDGNCAVGTFDVALDSEDPEVTITRVSRKVDGVASKLGLALPALPTAARPTLAGTASDRTSGVAMVLIEATASDGTTRTFMAECPGCGVGESDWTFDTAKLGRGTHSVVATAVDAAGRSKASAEVSLYGF